MLTRLATSVPLGPADALFARALARLSARVTGRACIEGCQDAVPCGSCSCGNGCQGDKFCDQCFGGFCDCYCPPPPIC